MNCLMSKKNFYRSIIFFILVIFCVFVILKLYYNDSYNNFGPFIIDGEHKKISHLHLKIKQHLLKALRYSRSQNVKKEIFEALSIISNLVNVDKGELKIERVNKTVDKGRLQDVCLEKYIGRIDYPLYFKGQGEIKCTKKPFEDVLTFVIISESCSELQNILKGIRKSYDNSKVVFGTAKDLNCKVSDNKVIIETVPSSAQGMVKLLKKVETDYVLVAPNIYHFDNTSRIERLVQMVSYTDIDIAAGGVRLESGHYQNGCYQMAMKMYTLKVKAGYDMSFNSCLYCDYSPAPFVARTSFLNMELSKLNKNIVYNGLWVLQLYANLMINNKPQMFVCPDAMFHVKPYDLALQNRKDWFPFVSWFRLNRLLLDGGQDINFSCAEATMTCDKRKGMVLPLCCKKELSDSLKFMNRLCQQQNVTFDVCEGTTIGSLKYNTILFWELDADVDFRVQSIDKLEAKLDDIKKQGYSMEISYECPFKRDHDKCLRAGKLVSIYFAYRTPNWRIQMYGCTYMMCDFRGELKEPTKIKIDDEWYITYTNPVLYVRNLYGGDVFQHVEHTAKFGSTDKYYEDIFSGRFAKCPEPGFHGCLDNFAGEGGLQFEDIYI